MKLISAVLLLVGFAAVLSSENEIIPYSRLPLMVNEAVKDDTHSTCVINHMLWDNISENECKAKDGVGFQQAWTCADEYAILEHSVNGKRNVCVKF